MARSISKKIRFEIFKRDNWTCRYCGKKPPGIVLEIDHVIPIVEGGGNEAANLVTSCFDCNRGKGKYRLDKNSTAVLKEPDFAITKERLEQLKAYYEHLTEIESMIDEYVVLLDEYWWHDLGRNDEYRFGEVRRASLRTFLHKTDYWTIRESMAIAFQTKPFWDVDDDKLYRYFCGIVNRKIRGIVWEGNENG